VPGDEPWVEVISERIAEAMDGGDGAAPGTGGASSQGAHWQLNGWHVSEIPGGGAPLGQGWQQYSSCGCPAGVQLWLPRWCIPEQSGPV